MPFRVCYYHLVWATKQRAPLITSEIEPLMISAIMQKSTTLESPIIAINSTLDHIHVAVSISTNIAVAEWVQGVKGFSAHEVNTNFPALSNRFSWQKGYGVLTFGAKNLSFVSSYIARQKEHHLDNTIELYLEQSED